jgi:hypothetical protein
MMIGCLLPRCFRLLGALSLLLVIASCGGDADVAISPGPPEPGAGLRVSGQVQLPNGQLAYAPSAWERFAALVVARVQALTGLNVVPVGRNVVVELVRISPDDVVNHDVPETIKPVASNSTNDRGQYDIIMPSGTDEFTCMFIVQVGSKAEGTRTRAFVSHRQNLDINFTSETAVRLILEQVPPADLCDFTPSDIDNIVSAIAAVPGDLICANVAECNAAAAGRARSDPGVQAAIQAAMVPPTTLAASIGSEDTSIPLDDAAAFPSSGAVLIDQELMTYTGKSGNTLTGVTRGVAGTVATHHFEGATVSLTTFPSTSPTPTPTATSTPLPPSPTETVGVSPTPTASALPTATSTATPTATLQVTPTVSPTATWTLRPAQVRLSIGHGSGAPGSTVEIDVSLQTNGQRVAGTQNDIVFDPVLVDLARGSDCQINPAIGDQLPECDEDPPTKPCKTLGTNLADCPAEGCPSGSEGLSRLRALVFATGNVNTIPDGVLYTCSFRVTGQVEATALLQNLGFIASDPSGNALDIVDGNGSITVLGAPVTPGASATPTATRTQTLIMTPTPTRTPTTPVVITPTPTTTLPAGAVRVSIGHGSGAPGSTVQIDVSLQTNGQDVAGTQNDIVFDPALVNLTTASNCQINAAIGDKLAGCDDDPQVGPCKQLQRNLADCPAAEGCPPGSDGMRRFRGFVFSTLNVNTIPDGVLYTCTFTVTGQIAATAVLQNLNFLASDPNGIAPTTVGGDGSVTVLGPTPTLGVASATPTLTRTPTPTTPVVNTPTPTTTLPPAAVRISIGHGSGVPGSTVQIDVALQTNGQGVAGTQNDIVFDPALVNLTNTGDCQINPAIGDSFPECDEVAPSKPCKALGTNLANCPAEGCPPGSDGLRRLRALVFTPQSVDAIPNVNTIPDGVLYTCSFTVTGQVAATAVLQNLGFLAADPEGKGLTVVGGSGSITVLGPTPTTALASATPTGTTTSTVTQTVTATPSDTPLPSNTPTETPTSTPTPTQTDTPTATQTPVPPAIDVGAVAGPAGSTVLVPVTLVSNDASVSAVSNDITYDPSLVEAALIDETPDCAVDERLAEAKSVFAKVLEGAGGKKVLRIGLIGLDDNSVLSNGVLYSCRFAINPNASVGSVTLDNAPGASDPNGETVPPAGSGGSIEITPAA